MRNRAFRPIAAIVSILLLTGVPAQAGPVVISQVVQVMNSYQNPPDLRLRNVTQNSSVMASGVKGSVQASSVDDSTDIGSLEISDSSLGVPGTSSSDSLLSGVALVSDPMQGGVDIIDTGDVEGTVCDCGEITVPGGGFPKWPLLFLAAIPLFFIHGCDDCEETTPSPTPTPTPPGEIPEPASLLLFGSGLAALGAGLRRRYSQAKLSAQIATAEEE